MLSSGELSTSTLCSMLSSGELSKSTRADMLGDDPEVK
jgi:hypothetical protein